MTKLLFPLNITLYSPTSMFKTYINSVPFKCMLDTGADIPMFCKGTALFREFIKEMQGVNVTEFKQSLIKPKVPCELILSVSMLIKMKYTIKYNVVR